MPENSRCFPLCVELAAAYQRAERVMAESRRLAADYEFIIQWYGMRWHNGARQENVLDDP
jgi:hypothetical protein